MSYPLFVGNRFDKGAGRARKIPPLTVRLSDEEWARLKADVKRSGLARAEYVRRRLFGGDKDGGQKR